MGPGSTARAPRGAVGLGQSSSLCPALITSHVPCHSGDTVAFLSRWRSSCLRWVIRPPCLCRCSPHCPARPPSQRPAGGRDAAGSRKLSSATPFPSPSPHRPPLHPPVPSLPFLMAPAHSAVIGFFLPLREYNHHSQGHRTLQFTKNFPQSPLSVCSRAQRDRTAIMIFTGQMRKLWPQVGLVLVLSRLGLFPPPNPQWPQAGIPLPEPRERLDLLSEGGFGISEG